MLLNRSWPRSTRTYTFVPLWASGWVLTLILGLVATAPLSASSERVKLRVFGAGLVTSGDDTMVATSDDLSANHFVGDATGGGLNLEILLGSRLGLEVTTVFADYDTEFEIAGGAVPRDRDNLGMYAIFLGLNYHFKTRRVTDFHLGIFGGINNYDDLIFNTEVGRQDKYSFDDDYGLGVKFGADFPLGASDNWLFHFDLRYLVTILEGEIGGFDRDLDPWILSVGVGYGF